jgi:transposase-like protein
MRGRRWKAEEKMAIVLEGLKGEKSVSEICREHKISQTQYYRWRDRFLEGGRRGLSSSSRDNGQEQSHKSEVERLEKIIGKMAVQIDILKKTEELFGTR